MFNKLMSSLGLQGIQVDTRLHHRATSGSKAIQGEVIFKGAASNKIINGIYLKLMTTAEVGTDDAEYNGALSIAEWHISRLLGYKPISHIHFLFRFNCHFETPITDVPCRLNKTRCGYIRISMWTGARCN